MHTIVTVVEQVRLLVPVVSPVECQHVQTMQTIGVVNFESDEKSDQIGAI
jgi:hypothetical protein